MNNETIHFVYLDGPLHSQTQPCQIGIALKQADESWKITLDVIPLSGSLRMAPPQGDKIPSPQYPTTFMSQED